MSEPDGGAPPAGEQLHIPKPSLQPVLVTVGESYTWRSSTIDTNSSAR